MKGWVFYAALPAVCWALFTHQPVALADMAMTDAIMTASPTTSLPKTRLRTCRNQTWDPIPCAGTGLDAEYADPAGSYDYGSPRGTGTWGVENISRFTTVVAGTVTDMATGLMWVADPDGSAGRGGPYNWTNAINASENLTFATYSDWRLPNVRELQSIVDWNVNNPTIDGDFFSIPYPPDAFWTSTTYEGNTTTAYAWHFEAGNCEVYNKTSTLWPILPVRTIK